MIETSFPAPLLEHLTQGVTQGLIIVNSQGIITSANQTAVALIGLSADQLVGESLDTFWPDAPINWTAVNRTYTQPITTELRDANGRLIPARLKMAALNETSKEPIFTLCITPLNDVAYLDEALSHTQRLASLGTLMASIAHELNTPVSIIAATCSNLQHEIENDALNQGQLLHYLELIDHSVWRSARILEVLRNYSYNDVPQFDVTNLNMVVEDALTLVRHQFRGQYDIDIVQELDESLPSLVCDHHRLTQVLLNLLNNASDAISDKQGTVHIKTWQMETAVTPTGNCPPSFALSVSDSGRGIEPEVMDKIFQPFFTTKPHGKGTGLGLYIAKRIIDQHNGRIWAENNPEGGTTFTIVLPRKVISD